MNILAQPEQLKACLKKHGLWAKKALGQNFLIDSDSLESIVNAGEISSDDFVMEVGPGAGVLTVELSKLAGSVEAVELDSEMIHVLKKNVTDLGDISKVTITEGDIRSVSLPDKPFKVIANIPYYLTDRIIRRFLEEAPVRPTTMVLLVQKEVAEKIVAKGGKESIPSIAVKAYGSAEIICEVPRHCFEPAPKVDSAVIRINTKESALKGDGKIFFRVLRAGFGMKRKKLLNALSGNLALDKELVAKVLESCDIDTSTRAEKLSLEQWIALGDAFAPLI